MASEFEKNLAKYADVAVHIGLNLQAGQRLFIYSPIEARSLAQAVTRSAYQAGAAFVHVQYLDPVLDKIRVEVGAEETLDEFPQWLSDGVAQHDGGEQFSQLGLLESAREAKRTDLVAVQPRGEVTQNGVRFVGGDALDDQLSPRDADRQRGRLVEERGETTREIIDGREQQRMRTRIDRVLVHGHGQLDEQVGVVLWKRGVDGSGDDRAHIGWPPRLRGSPISGARSASPDRGTL